MYDIFISYRRKGGYETAKHLFDLLSRDGYKVSFDIDTLRNGDFDISLLKRVEECIDFILIVDEHAFDKCIDPTFDRNKDWLRCELAHALLHNKNIVPVMLAGVDFFPENLPDDIKAVVKKNGPKHNMDYFDSFYNRLCKNFLESKCNQSKMEPSEDEDPAHLKRSVTSSPKKSQEEEDKSLIDKLLSLSTNDRTNMFEALDRMQYGAASTGIFLDRRDLFVFLMSKSQKS